MKIAIIGPGAMGLLYGGYLSKNNEVVLIGRNVDSMEQLNAKGITIEEKDGSVNNYKVTASCAANAVGVVDLAIVFVKTYTSVEALEAAKSIIGPQTILMTLQNGLGNEKALLKYTDAEHVIVGNTNQGSSRVDCTTIRHSGLGDTFLGVASGDVSRFEHIREMFEQCGFPCIASNDVKQLIWNKLMINASSSVLSGILQVPQGYIANNPNAWNIACNLITEMCDVAVADGYSFDASEQIDRIKAHLEAAPDGLTSIYNDIKNGRLTEVSVINGAVADVAHMYGLSVPTHKTIINLVHALEVR